MRLQMVARTGHPDLLDLPWDRWLEEWDTPRLANVPRGISRHVVRFVRYDIAGTERLYAVKELPRRLADREYRLLTELRDRGLPAVAPVGVISGRAEIGTGAPIDAALITQHLEFALPYRSLFSRQHWAGLHDKLVDALVDLLARLHLAGFMWGDCSLSNTLFRRDAGELAAYLVDAETSELHPSLTDGQRRQDVELAVVNVAGELSDLAAAGTLSSKLDPIELGLEVGHRYDLLWDELTRAETFGPDERWRIDERLRRLNDLGFDVRELDLTQSPDGTVHLRLNTKVVDKGHHRRRLRELTGLDVQEGQARRLLNDLYGNKAWRESALGRTLSDAQAAQRWMQEVFEPTVDAIPDEYRGRREPAQVFHEVLDHRYFLAQDSGGDVPLAEAVGSYVRTVLPALPEERALVTAEGEPTNDEQERT